MKIFITGASGFVGNRLAHTLAEKGNEVHALVRTAAAEKILLHPKIKIFRGDILDYESLIKAMEGCTQVYHTAAMVKVWSKSPSLYYDVNVQGTKNVLNAMIETRAEKLVFTSTCGVIGPSLNEPMQENDPRITGFQLDYELSKKMAEDLVFQYGKEGLHAIVVSPSKIYGPGNFSHSLTANAVIKQFLKYNIVFVPGPSFYKASFAFLDDIVNGHILAMEHGVKGEKYILGGVNIAYVEFFKRIRKLAKCKGWIVPVPKPVIKCWAMVQWVIYKITGIHPSFSARSADVVFSNYIFSSEKAIHQLGYYITPLDEAIRKTIHYLKNQSHEQE